MPTMKMTKREIERLPAPDPTGGQQIYWAEGSDHPGLGILVSGTTSAKSWVVQAKLPRTGIARRVTLGPVAVLSLDEAWDKARPVLADIHSGVDPKAKKHKPATVREVLERYLANPKLRPRSRDHYRSRVERHLKDWLEMSIGSINATMVEARFRAITSEVEARRAAGGSRGSVNVTGAASANGALAAFRSLWRYQKTFEPTMPAEDPTSALSRQWHELERRKRLVTTDQMPAFYAGVAAMMPENDRDHRPGKSRLYHDLLMLELYAGWREMELCGLRWDELDLREKMVHIPAKRMKAKKDFDLPMSRQMAGLLIARRALGKDGPFVFPAESESGHTQAMNFALKKIAKATAVSISPHDLRRTYISIAQTCLIPAISVKLLVAHTTRDVTEGYTHLEIKQLRAAAQTVADRIDELCGIAPVEGVVRLEATR